MAKSRTAWTASPPRGSLWAWVACVSALTVLSVCSERIQGDAWWDLTIGRWEWQHHTLALVNLWGSHALGRPWINPEWAWGFVLVAAQSLGRGGWILVLAIGITAYFAGIAAVLQQAAVPPAWRVFALFGSLFVAEGAWTWTPVVWAVPCAVWAWWGLGRIRQIGWHPAALRMSIGLLGLTTVWALIHPSWILVPIWIGCALLTMPDRRWRYGALAWLAALAGAIAISQPWGWAYLGQPFAGLTDPWVAIVSPEWRHLPWHQPAVLALYGSYALSTGAVLWQRWRTSADRRAVGMALGYALAFGGAAVWAVRWLPYLPLGWIVAATGAPPPRLSWAWLPPRWAAWSAALGAAGLIGIIGLTGVRQPALPVSAQDPQGVAAVLADHGYGPGTPVFNTLALGGYLEYVGLRPWIDGREDFWRQQGPTLAAYAQAQIGRASPVALARRAGLTLAVLSRTGLAPTWVAQFRRAQWQVVWHDAQTVLLIAPGTPWPRPMPTAPAIGPVPWRI
jgi:hypothetical protein